MHFDETLIFSQPPFDGLGVMHSEIIDDEMNFSPLRFLNKTLHKTVIDSVGEIFLVTHKPQFLLVCYWANHVHFFVWWIVHAQRGLPFGRKTTTSVVMAFDPSFINPLNFGTFFFLPVFQWLDSLLLAKSSPFFHFADKLFWWGVAGWIPTFLDSASANH